MNTAALLAPIVQSQPHTAHTARGRCVAASRSALPRSIDELQWSDHILCVRLERMPVSTWNMMVWAGMMTSEFPLNVVLMELSEQLEKGSLFEYLCR